MREPTDAGNAKKTGPDRMLSSRSSRSRSGSSVKSQTEAERRVYVPNTPTRPTLVSGRLNGPPARGQSTPIKARSDSASRAKHGALAKRSPARNSSRSKVGLSLNFRKVAKSSKSSESNNSETSKRGPNECASVSVDERNQKLTKFTTNAKSSTDHAVIENEKKAMMSRNASSGRRFGLALSFRKGSKSQVGGGKGPGKTSETSICDSSTATNASLESKESSNDVPWLRENLKDVLAENVTLKNQVKMLEKELETSKLARPDVISPLLSKPCLLTSTILDETADNYSLFDVSQHHDFTTLQEQVSKLHEHNASTNEELQATLEELKDLRVKSNDLRIENQSLVGERKLLCESLCQQSERAERFEQEMEVLKNLILSNLENPDDFQRRLAEIHRLVDLDRSSIMSQFDVLKEKLSEVELELKETREKVGRLRDDRNRWRAKYEHLKQLHAGYSSRLSSKSLSDQENRPPPTDSAFSILKERCRQQQAEIARLNGLLQQREQQQPRQVDSAQAEVASLRERMARDRRSWDGFQADLLTAVRVAEAFRVTAEEDAKRLAADNERLHGELGAMRKQVENLRRSGFGLVAPPMVSNSSVKAMVHSLEARIREYGAKVAGGEDSSGRALPRRPRDAGEARDEDWFQEPLSDLIRNGGSRRNALLQWCQRQADGYAGTDITNFSSSWTDGLALCAIIHSFRPELVPYTKLIGAEDREANLRLAFGVLEQLGVDCCGLTPAYLSACERPEWSRVMRLVTRVFCFFETGRRPRQDPELGLRPTLI